MIYSITAKQRRNGPQTFRRAGIQFGPVPTLVNSDEIGEDRMQAILDEPMLVVEETGLEPEPAERHTCTRAELDEIAAGMGLDTTKLPNKDAVIEAIKAKEAELAAADDRTQDGDPQGDGDGE